MSHACVASETFTYDQLSDEAKAKAREWWQGLACRDDGWWEPVYEDSIKAFSCLGFSVEPQDMAFSGFWSQGDGASFGGFFEPTEKTAVEAITEYAPEDQTLLRLAERVDVLQTTARLRWSTTGWAARVYKTSNYYSHSGCMRAEDARLREWNEHDNPEDETFDRAHDEILAIARELADWHYAQLEKEHEYQTSDEVAKEALEGSGYRFDEDGHII